jgi:hypothetical protein
MQSCVCDIGMVYDKIKNLTVMTEGTANFKVEYAIQFQKTIRCRIVDLLMDKYEFDNRMIMRLKC